MAEWYVWRECDEGLNVVFPFFFFFFLLGVSHDHIWGHGSFLLDLIFFLFYTFSIPSYRITSTFIRILTPLISLHLCLIMCVSTAFAVYVHLCAMFGIFPVLSLYCSCIHVHCVLLRDCTHACAHPRAGFSLDSFRSVYCGHDTNRTNLWQKKETTTMMYLVYSCCICCCIFGCWYSHNIDELLGYIIVLLYCPHSPVTVTNLRWLSAASWIGTILMCV